MFAIWSETTLPDGRKVIIEIDERSNVRTTMVVDGPPPKGTSPAAWEGGMEARAMSSEQWERTQKTARGERAKLFPVTPELITRIEEARARTKKE